MKKRNKRQMFPSKGTKILFIIYILLSFLLMLVTASVILQDLILKLSFGKFLFTKILTIDLIFPLFMTWTGYGFFLAWFWVKTEMKGLVFRISRIFDEISEGNSVKLTFRRKDPFHQVAKSFNHMIKVIAPPVDTRKKLEELAETLDDEKKSALNNILEEWPK